MISVERSSPLSLSGRPGGAKAPEDWRTSTESSREVSCSSRTCSRALNPPIPLPGGDLRSTLQGPVPLLGGAKGWVGSWEVSLVSEPRLRPTNRKPRGPQPLGCFRALSAVERGSGLRVCAKITSGFGGSAAWPDARREEGASPCWGCDRRATPQPAMRRPAPEGWGDFAFWVRGKLIRSSNFRPTEYKSQILPI